MIINVLDRVVYETSELTKQRYNDYKRDIEFSEWVMEILTRYSDDKHELKFYGISKTVDCEACEVIENE